jgi:hypothetical protein
VVFHQSGMPVIQAARGLRQRPSAFTALPCVTDDKSVRESRDTMPAFLEHRNFHFVIPNAAKDGV